MFDFQMVLCPIRINSLLQLSSHCKQMTVQWSLARSMVIEDEDLYQRIILKQVRSKLHRMVYILEDLQCILEDNSIDGASFEFIIVIRYYLLRYELEESSEFLQPVDSGAPVLVDEDDYAALEDIKTKLYPGPPSTTHYTYDRVPWTLKIRKEVFSPSETLNSPLAINLIFCQVQY